MILFSLLAVDLMSGFDGGVRMRCTCSHPRAGFSRLTSGRVASLTRGGVMRGINMDINMDNGGDHFFFLSFFLKMLMPAFSFCCHDAS